ncbi:hypothetical protein T484DRAFT_1942007 [Baffinella frigidus]|nr:hypothetical protein T484DRAFT_1942007 [Cryptophyta sp. CCMP2293]
MAGYVHMETWVRNGTNGIGISDHQNRYSNGVRIANWTENQFGDDQQRGGIVPPVFNATTTARDDYRQYDKDPDDRRVTNVASSGVQMGPRRVDSFLWSGVTAVDTKVPTSGNGKMSLLEKKRAEWKSEKESTWQTAYGKQYLTPEAAPRQMKGVIMMRKDDSNFKSDKRPHLEMNLRSF